MNRSIPLGFSSLLVCLGGFPRTAAQHTLRCREQQNPWVTLIVESLLLRQPECLYVYVWVITWGRSMDQPGMVANPAHGQLNRENEYFPVPVCAREFGLARRVRQPCPASACSFSTLRVNLVLTHGIPPDFRGGVHLFIPPYAIGSSPSLSGHAIAYRWRSLPRVHRHRASSPQGSSSNGCCLRRSHHGPINVCPSFPRPLLVCSGHDDMCDTGSTGGIKKTYWCIMRIELMNSALRRGPRGLLIIEKDTL